MPSSPTNSHIFVLFSPRRPAAAFATTGRLWANVYADIYGSGSSNGIWGNRDNGMGMGILGIWFMIVLLERI